MLSEDGAIGAAEEEAGAMVLSELGAIGAAEEDEAIGAADEDDAIGASDDDDESTTLLDDDTVFTGVVVAGPRLKIQIRPMITITTTIMIIQVLRFMG